MSNRILQIAALALGLVATLVLASANGLLYICDTAKLSSENLCYFVADTNANTVGASPHNIDITVAADGFRVVKDSAGNTLSVTPKPWTQGDVLAASTTQQTGDALAYAKAFELVAPLRDKMMYSPGDLTTSETEWAKWTKAFTDCRIKETTTQVTEGTHTVTAYSTTDIYALSKNPNSQDIHHGVLQYLEEGAIDLVCVMCPGLSMDRCTTMRTTLGLADGVASTCWEAAHSAIYGSSTTASGATTAVPSVVTASPSTSSTSGASGVPFVVSAIVAAAIGALLL